MMASLSTLDGGSIGNVIHNIVLDAAEAVQQLPRGTLAEQVTLATKLNVFSTIEKVIKNSPVVKELVTKGEVQVHGSVYDIFTGQVLWLGEHPKLAEVVGAPMPIFKWKMAPYKRPTMNANEYSPAVSDAIQRLKRGNIRFLSGEHSMAVNSGREVADPYAIIIGGAEKRLPIEKVFDASPGDLIVQRSMGSIAGRPGATLFDSIEYAVVRFAPKLLLVLCESDSEVITNALAQVSGALPPSPAMRSVLDRVMVSALRATQQCSQDPSLTAAGREMKLRQLTVELNAMYTVEQLCSSAIIRDAIREHGLDIHVAILSRDGEVEFIGRHPMQDALLDEGRYKRE